MCKVQLVTSGSRQAPIGQIITSVQISHLMLRCALLMISKKQEEDEQFSDLLQTAWSENNIKGKEQLHAHVKLKREKLTLQM